MSASVAEVVAQLLAAAGQLDTAAVAATRAGTDAEQAHGNFTDAGRGSNDREIRAAVNDSSVAAAKANKIARLLAQAANHLTDYANHIAPGSVSGRTASDSAMPTGEELVADSAEREIRRSAIPGFLNRGIRKADDIQDRTSQAVDVVQAMTNALRHPHGSGTQSSGTVTPSAPTPPPQAHVDISEAAGSLVVIGLLTGVAIQRASKVINKWTARLRREHYDEPE